MEAVKQCWPHTRFATERYRASKLAQPNFKWQKDRLLTRQLSHHGVFEAVLTFHADGVCMLVFAACIAG
jgi:hypothetical protein